MPQQHMIDGEAYELDPPSVIHGKKFPFVTCEYQVPGKPNEYVVGGIPEGGSIRESFLLVFTGRGVKVTPAKDKPPRLKLAE